MGGPPKDLDSGPVHRLNKEALRSLISTLEAKNAGVTKRLADAITTRDQQLTDAKGLKGENAKLQGDVESLKRQVSPRAEGVIAEKRRLIVILRDQLAAAEVENAELRGEVGRLTEVFEAAEELVECAQLRGDNCLPLPEDDPVLWTARMQEAWNHIEELLNNTTPGSEHKPSGEEDNPGSTWDERGGFPPENW